MKIISIITLLIVLNLITACGGSSENVAGTDISPPTGEPESNNQINDNIPDDNNSINQPINAIFGEIDSSYISPIKNNKLFVFDGAMNSDDIINNNLAITIIDIQQNNDDLSWEYSIDALPDGDYTLAIVTTSNINISAINDAKLISKITTISFNNSTQETLQLNIDAENVIRIGLNKEYKTPSSAYPYISDGDVVEIDSGIYLNDIVVWRQNNITLRGINGKAHLKATNTIAYSNQSDATNGKAIWVIKGNNVKIENIEFSGASVADKNGAGIRHEGENLFISNCYFHNNENGILGGGGIVLIEYSEFSHNGFGDGYSHNMYIGNKTSQFIFRHSNSHHAHIGHNLKSRAAENHILYSRLMDEINGDSSYGIDLPNGGNAYIIGNIIQQSPYTDNSTMLSFGAEGLTYLSNDVFIINNTMVNDRYTGTFIRIADSATANVTNNLFIGKGTQIKGSVSATTNLHSVNDPGFIDIGNYNYQLTNTATTIIDQGTNLTNPSLFPIFQYINSAQRTNRKTNGRIDIGAYEFN